MTAYLGIDPGASGAIASIDRESGALLSVFDLPYLGKEVDASYLSTLLLGLPEGSTAILEVQQPQGRAVRTASGQWSTTMSAGSTATMMMAYGALIASLAICQVRVVRVSPSVWKKAMGLSTDKGQSLRMARELWPSADVFTGPRGGGKDGRAEAALLAEHGRLKRL